MAAKSKGLGRGLDSLIPVDETIEAETKIDVSRETLMNINLIEPNKTQPRRNFDQDALQELTESIKIHGIIQPIVVQKKGKMYEIIAGERRWRAARQAGLKEVPVIVKDYSPEEIFEIALIENIQRQDLNPIEEAQAYQRLIEENKLKQDEVAERVSKSRVSITNSMRLLKLDERVQQMVVDEMLSSGHARALLSVEDKELQYTLAMKVFDEKLSVRETEKLVKKGPEKTTENKKKSFDNEAIYKNYEDNMKTLLGSKVEIQRKSNSKGKIVIDYYNDEEFERIYEIITAASKNQQ